MTQHAGLTLERWRGFDRHRQVLMIANEMHRARVLEDPESLRRAYERVLRLVDLTVQAAEHPPFLRELLRWRDGIAELYLAAEAAPDRHREMIASLLLLSTEAARQRAFVLR